MRNRHTTSSILRFGFTSFIGLSSLVGCQADDGSDILGRSGFGIADDSVQGEFVTRIADMVDGTSRVSHHLTWDGGEVEIKLAEGSEIERGAYVQAWGDYDNDGALVLDDFEILSGPPQPLIDGELFAPRRLATILVYWNQGGLPNPEGKEAMFTGDRSTNIFYAENSYGKETMAGEVFGPYEIPDPGACTPGSIADAAIAAFEERGHKKSDYRQFLYHFPGMSGCGWAGLASVGSPAQPARDSWYNGSFGCVVRNQEIGHNYGMGHSHRYECRDENGAGVPFSTDCEHVEYGDRYDPMGGGCGHMNVVQKAYMGWLEGCNIVTGTADGTFNLSPAELPCNGTQALRFPTADGRFFYLEYRQPLGEFDGRANMSGVLVHIADEIRGFGPSPYLLEMNSDDFMHEGDSYTNPSGSVTFNILEEHPTHAVIQVQYADGGANEPTCFDDLQPEIDSNGHVGRIECASEPFPGDLEAPTVQITFPEDGAVIEPGSDFSILAEASDDRFVTEAELYVDGEPLFKLFEGPWEWDVTNIPEGTYEFGVVARDSRNWTPSNAVTITVKGTPDVDPGGTDGADDGGDDGSGDDEGGAQNSAEDGCGCRHTGSGAPSFTILLLAMGLVRRRRR